MKSSWLYVCLFLILSSTFYIESVSAGTMPVLHYTFDSGVEDVTGNGLDGTLVGDAYIDNGLLILDGDDDAVETPTIGIVYELTYAMWVFPEVDLVPLQFSGGINTHDWVTGAVHFKLNYGMLNVGINGFGNDVVGVTPVYSDEWTHIALTISETEVVMYLNGMVDAFADVTAPLELVIGDATVGAWNLDREWTGMMDDVRIYDVALSEAEIDSLSKILPGSSSNAVQQSNNIPTEFALAQNYPNPFNPTTTIAYSLETSGMTKVSVYDLRGNKVASLVDGLQSAGQHQIQFDGTNLTSGIYFYKLQTANQILTRKMMLVK